MRHLIKPLIFKLLGNKVYEWFYYRAKISDIKRNKFIEPELEYICSILNQSDEIIDIGANYGHFSTILSNYVSDGKVYAFEPIPFTFRVNQKIIKTLKIPNIELYNKGVGEKATTLEFTIPKLDFGGLNTGLAHIKRKGDKDEMEQVNAEIIAIDEFLKNKLNRLSFIKIDIEGTELFALKGLEQTIKKFKPTIMIEVSVPFLQHYNIKQEDLIDFVENKIGYTFYIYNSSDKTLKKYDGKLMNSNYFLLPK